MRARATRRAALVCALGLLFGLMMLCSGGGPVDDTYIYLRYAQHFASGDGLVFNAGERIEGFTSPLWMALLACASAAGIDLVVASVAASAAFGFASVLLVYFSARGILLNLDPLVAFVAAAWLALLPGFAFWSATGMEASAVACFTLLGVLTTARAVQGQRFGLAASALAGALATATRPDASVLVAAIGIAAAHALRFRARAWKILAAQGAACAATFFSLALVRHAYYGDWLPNTYYAKLAVPRQALLRNGAGYGLEFVVALAPWLLLFLLTLHLARRTGTVSPALRMAAFALPTWWLFVVWAGGDHFGHFRFFVPVLPLLAVGLVHGGAWIDARVSRWSPLARVHLALLTIFSTFIAAGGTLFSNNGLQARGEAYVAKQWRTVGEWLAASVPASTRIALVPVGAIPYYSGLYVYDMAGLTNREIALHGDVYEYAKPGHHKFDIDYVLREQPDLILFAISGTIFEPRKANASLILIGFEHSLYGILEDRRTEQLYAFDVARMPNGRYVEFLRRRDFPALAARD